MEPLYVSCTIVDSASPVFELLGNEASGERLGKSALSKGHRFIRLRVDGSAERPQIDVAVESDHEIDRQEAEYIDQMVLDWLTDNGHLEKK